MLFFGGGRGCLVFTVLSLKSFLFSIWAHLLFLNFPKSHKMALGKIHGKHGKLEIGKTSSKSSEIIDQKKVKFGWWHLVLMFPKVSQNTGRVWCKGRQSKKSVGRGVVADEAVIIPPVEVWPVPKRAHNPSICQSIHVPALRLLTGRILLNCSELFQISLQNFL